MSAVPAETSLEQHLRQSVHPKSADSQENFRPPLFPENLQSIMDRRQQALPLVGMGMGDDVEWLENGLPGPGTIVDYATMDDGKLKQLMLDSLHCHFSWVQKLADVKNISNEVRDLNFWIEETQHHSQPAIVGITQKGLSVVFACLEDRMSDAEENMKEFRGFLSQTKEDLVWQKKWGQVEAYRYFTMCTKAFHAFYKNDKVGVAKILRRVQDVDLRGPSTQSALLVLFSSFKAHLKCATDYDRQKILTRAIELDPESAEGHHYLYRVTRKIRRGIDYKSKPSQQEKDLVAQTLLLASHEVWAEDNQALLDRECGDHATNTRPMAYNAFLKDLKTKSIATNVAVAVLESKRHFNEARKKFEIMLQTWPNNSEVMHKAGVAYFHNGQKRRGLDLMLKSVLSNKCSVNYPGLFDYVRHNYKWIGSVCLPEVLKQLQLALEVGTEADNVSRSRVLFTIGGIQWTLFNKDAALESWTQAVLKDPTSSTNSLLYNMVCGPTIKRLTTDADRQEIVDAFVAHLEKQKESENDALFDECIFDLIVQRPIGRKLRSAVTVPAAKAIVEASSPKKLDSKKQERNVSPRRSVSPHVSTDNSENVPPPARQERVQESPSSELLKVKRITISEPREQKTGLGRPRRPFGTLASQNQ